MPARPSAQEVLKALEANLETVRGAVSHVYPGDWPVRASSGLDEQLHPHRHLS